MMIHFDVIVGWVDDIHFGIFPFYWSIIVQESYRGVVGLIFVGSW